MNDIVKALRAMYLEGYDVECPLSDAHILSISKEIPGTVGADDETDLQRVNAMHDAVTASQEADDETEATAPPAKAGVPHQRQWAREQAARIDATFDTELSALVDADETKKQSRVLVCEDLIRTYGEDLYSFPVPNSTDEDVKGTNHKADKYSIKVLGSDKKDTGSFWGDLADSTRTGRATIQALNHLDVSAKDANDPSLPDDFKGLGKSRRVSLYAKYRGRQASLRNLFRNGARLAMKLAEIKHNLPNVYCAYVREKDGKGIVVSPKPILIGEKADLTQVEAISVTQLMSYKITDDVISKGTAEALMATADRAKKDSKSLPPIEKLEQATDYATTFANYFDLGTSEGQAREASLLKMLQNPKTTDDVIETWYLACSLVGDVFPLVAEERRKRLEARPKTYNKAA